MLTTKNRNHRPGLRETEFKKYEVKYDTFHLSTGETVAPSTFLGFHPLSGKPVEAGLYGRIATIHYNPKNDSLMIMAVSDNET